MSSIPPVSDLDTHLGYWMRMVSNHVSQAFASKLSAKGVTVAEWCLMRTLYEKPPNPPSGLAETMGMTRGAISKLADRLVAKSLILRAPSPDDGRAHTLTLTPRGRSLVPDLAALADSNDAELFADLAPEERAALETLLKRIAARRGMTGMPLE